MGNYMEKTICYTLSMEILSQLPKNVYIVYITAIEIYESMKKR